VLVESNILLLTGKPIGDCHRRNLDTRAQSAQGSPIRKVP
jgi:hypothetical protein